MLSSAEGAPKLLPPDDLLVVLKSHQPEDVLLLDLRVFAQYSTSRINNALNLCIPTTLLKRASYNVQRLADTFISKKGDKEKFGSWRDTKIIITYDAASSTLQEATSCSHILKKFINEEWKGTTYVLKGGFNHFAKVFPEHIDCRSNSQMDGAHAKKLSLDPQSAAPVAGGCAMPPTNHAANPFFGTIRQNMDLIDGVGQIPLKRPASLMDSDHVARKLPLWLAIASDPDDKGRAVADRFLEIERAEQRRMQNALSTESWNNRQSDLEDFSTRSPRQTEGQNSQQLDPEGISTPSSRNRKIQIAGIEKGIKNRYKDILPFDHTRVRLQHPTHDCDYINASHISSERSPRHYIAGQAPVPATFTDFWQHIWEQDVRTIIMLTAENEGGQTKSHPYWIPGEYGPFTICPLSTKCAHLDPKAPTRTPWSPDSGPKRHGTNGGSYFSPPLPIRSAVQSQSKTPSHRLNSPSQISSHRPNSPLKSLSSDPADLNRSHATIRVMALTHSEHPFAPMREITQVHYASWPDFGTPASARDLLGLVELCQPYLDRDQNGDAGEGSGSGGYAVGAKRKGKRGRPSVVHCSAGCGRTGTFCTIDTVLGLVKKQLAGSDGAVGGSLAASRDRKPARAAHDWLQAERWEGDLVRDTVEEFRRQRLSMVQNLRQFVLCYEAVMEALVAMER